MITRDSLVAVNEFSVVLVCRLSVVVIGGKGWFYETDKRSADSSLDVETKAGDVSLLRYVLKSRITLDS